MQKVLARRGAVGLGLAGVVVLVAGCGGGSSSSANNFGGGPAARGGAGSVPTANLPALPGQRA